MSKKTPKAPRKAASRNDFATFFRTATKEEKMTLLKKVVREASEDQREIIRKYDERFPSKKNRLNMK